MTPRCAGEWRLFDALIDDANPTLAARSRALAMCALCDLRDACWAERADEPWVELVATAPLDSPIERPCESPLRRHTCPRDGCLLGPYEACPRCLLDVTTPREDAA